jgi:ABC-type thiamine transport system substrate-binding protein
LHAVSGRAVPTSSPRMNWVHRRRYFRSHAAQIAASDAPLTWIPMDLVPTNAGAVSLPINAPHPHAAVLLIDFMLTPEVQAIFEKGQQGSPAKDYGFKRWYPEEAMNSEQYDKARARGRNCCARSAATK